MNHIADDHDALLDYLYEEGDPAERLKVAQHLQECAACSVAVLELQNVRGMLSDWTPPPAPSLSAPVNFGARSGWWRGWLRHPNAGAALGTPRPATHQEKLTGSRSRAFLQAAAAVLLFVAGMAVSQLRVDYGDGAVTLRTRSTAPGHPNAAAALGTPPAASQAGPRNASITLPAQTVNTAASYDVDALKRELRAWLASQNASSVDTERLFQRVRAMIDQSEQRQQRELALRLSQASRELDTQHQADLLRVQQDFGQQQEALEYLVRTSGGVK